MKQDYKFRSKSLAFSFGLNEKTISKLSEIDNPDIIQNLQIIDQQFMYLNQLKNKNKQQIIQQSNQPFSELSSSIQVNNQFNTSIQKINLQETGFHIRKDLMQTANQSKTVFDNLPKLENNLTFIKETNKQLVEYRELEYIFDQKINSQPITKYEKQTSINDFPQDCKYELKLNEINTLHVKQQDFSYGTLYLNNIPSPLYIQLKTIFNIEFKVFISTSQDCPTKFNCDRYETTNKFKIFSEYNKFYNQKIYFSFYSSKEQIFKIRFKYLEEIIPIKTVKQLKQIKQKISIQFHSFNQFQMNIWKKKLLKYLNQRKTQTSKKKEKKSMKIFFKLKIILNKKDKMNLCLRKLRKMKNIYKFQIKTSMENSFNILIQQGKIYQKNSGLYFKILSINKNQKRIKLNRIWHIGQ